MKNKKTESPVFYEPTDGTWHYRQRYLTTNMQIGFQISEEGYDTPEEAMYSYLQDHKVFSDKMKALKDKQPWSTDLRQELLRWYHNIYLLVVNGSTVVTSSYVLYHFILPNLGPLGDKKLDRVTAKDINELIGSLNGCCDTAEAQTYKFLNIFFKEMYTDRKIRANPMDLVTPYRFNGNRKVVPAYTESEIATLLMSARKTIHFFEIYLMLLGLRTGEIRGLREDDFDVTEQTVHIQRQIVRQDEVLYSADGKVDVKKTGVAVKATKTESSDRILRVPTITFELLDERIQGIDDARKRRLEKGLSWDDTFADYICRSDTGKIKSESTLLTALKRVCSSEKLPIVSPHDLRHITATLMFEHASSNTDQPSEEILKEVSKYLGHSSTNITFDIYMDYVQSLSRIRNVSESLMDPLNEFSRLEGRVSQ